MGHQRPEEKEKGRQLLIFSATKLLYIELTECVTSTTQTGEPF
jgi:hypothetical protein